MIVAIIIEIIKISVLTIQTKKSLSYSSSLGFLCERPGILPGLLSFIQVLFVNLLKESKMAKLKIT